METPKEDGARGSTKPWTERGNSHRAATSEQHEVAAFGDHEEDGGVIEPEGMRAGKSSFRCEDR